MPLALIDIGSNTIKLVVYALEDGRRDDSGYARIFSKKVTAGLADYVDDAGALTEQGIDCACEALSYLHSIVDNLHIDRLHVFATASLRNIVNSAQALQAIDERTGLDVELISGDEEALLGFAAFQSDREESDGVLVDIGGGSTEITTFQAGIPTEATSVPVGSLKLFVGNVADVLPSREECAEIREKVEHVLDRAGFANPAHKELLCAIGGTARAAYKLVTRCFGKERPCGVFTRTELEGLVQVLEGDFPTARKLVLRSCPDRVHTIVPGLIILQAIARRFDVGRVEVSRAGVREGYLLEHAVCSNRPVADAL